MRKKAMLTRVVLVVALFATVATSAPQGYTIDDQIEQAAVTGVHRVVVRANQAAVMSADSFVLAIEISDGRGGTIQIVADDPRLPPLSVVEAGNHELDLDVVCDGRTDCDVGFTIDVPEGESVHVIAIATLERFGDGSFCFPEKREFPPEATVEVTFE